MKIAYGWAPTFVLHHETEEIFEEDVPELKIYRTVTLVPDPQERIFDCAICFEPRRMLVRRNMDGICSVCVNTRCCRECIERYREINGEIFRCPTCRDEFILIMPPVEI